MPKQFWVGGRYAEGPRLSSQSIEIDLPTGTEFESTLRFGQNIAVLVLKENIHQSLHSDKIFINKIEEVLVLTDTPDVSLDTRWGETATQWENFKIKTTVALRDLGLNPVETPTLVINPGMEPTLDSFATQWKLGSSQMQLSLPTSPEIHLKQLLAMGFTDIFEIKKCFRSDEKTQIHEPEFTMLEWYRAFANLEIIEQDMRKLLLGFDANVEFVVHSIPILFKEALNFDLRPNTKLTELQALADTYKIEYSSDDTWDDVFSRIMFQKIENQLDPEKATFLYHYPPSQAALARLTKEGWADRFELYWKGLEIANAFHELNDPDEQLRRHQADQLTRKERAKPIHPIDNNFIRALRQGMPPSGGVALGLDRLFMAVYGFKSIADIRVFPIEHQLRAIE